VELFVPVVGFFFYSTEMGRHRDAVDSFSNSPGRAKRFALPNIARRKQELPVQVRNVDRVHVDHVDGFEPAQA